MIEKIGEVTLNYSFYKEGNYYNEGDEVEEKILEVVKTTDDYTQILKGDNRWPILYQLSKQRENIILPMDLKKEDEVLEIGSGMGAITGALARNCKKVDCIELSKRRSLANAYRNKTYDNIEIFVGNFEDIKLEKQYDVITLIGVLEYAQSYIHSDKPYIDFLKKIHATLKKGGKLYIAIENKLGMKYFAGCAEDHLGKPFIGIEGYSKDSYAKTFTKSQLIALLKETGFQDCYFYYPYPDYKLPSVFYSDDYLPDKQFSISDQNNFDLDRIMLFSEKSAIKSIAKTEEIKILANSFLVEAER